MGDFSRQEGGSIDDAIGALYDVISGEAGAACDWPVFRSLFHDDARLIRSAAGAAGAEVRIMTPAEYQEQAEPRLRDGFHERETERWVERAGQSALAISRYECRDHRLDPEPHRTGVNIIHLVRVETRWLILVLAWSIEDAGIAGLPGCRIADKTRSDRVPTVDQHR